MRATFAEFYIEKADRALRGTCQADDCYEVARVSDTKTSLAYCYGHFWDTVNRWAWANYDLFKLRGAI